MAAAFHSPWESGHAVLERHARVDTGGAHPPV
jgi:hypothetical protein